MAYPKGENKSRGSIEAIENFRVPLCMITEKTIQDLLSARLEDKTLNEADYHYLQRFKPGVWQYVSKECVENTEWHHFGLCYSRKFHYDLNSAMEYILANRSHIVRDYIHYRLSYKEEERNTDYMDYPIWKFSYNIWSKGRHPRIIAVQSRIGLDDGRAVYFLEPGRISRKKWAANNIFRLSEKKYEELDDKTKNEIDIIREFFRNNDVEIDQCHSANHF